MRWGKINTCLDLSTTADETVVAVRAVRSPSSGEVVGSVGVRVELDWLGEEVRGVREEGWVETYLVDEGGYVVAAITGEPDQGSVVSGGGSDQQK